MYGIISSLVIALALFPSIFTSAAYSDMVGRSDQVLYRRNRLRNLKMMPYADIQTEFTKYAKKVSYLPKPATGSLSPPYDAAGLSGGKFFASINPGNDKFDLVGCTGLCKDFDNAIAVVITDEGQRHTIEQEMKTAFTQSLNDGNNFQCLGSTTVAKAVCAKAKPGSTATNPAGSTVIVQFNASIGGTGNDFMIYTIGVKSGGDKKAFLDQLTDIVELMVDAVLEWNKIGDIISVVRIPLLSGDDLNVGKILKEEIAAAIISGLASGWKKEKDMSKIADMQFSYDDDAFNKGWNLIKNPPVLTTTSTVVLTTVGTANTTVKTPGPGPSPVTNPKDRSSAFTTPLVSMYSAIVYTLALVVAAVY